MPVSIPALPATPRPFLKWAGGKHQLISQYSPFFPPTFQTYHEPFLGGGAIFFHLSAHLHQAILTDLNPELVNVYCCIRDHVEAVIEQLMAHRQNHSRDHYYQVRSQLSTCPVERAARLIYLNKTCFNGLYRENSQGKFNVPMGRYKNPSIFTPEGLYAASQALQKAKVVVSSFETVLERACSAQDFVYFDPPYYPISPTSNFTGYNRYAFGEVDQIKLRDTFQILAQRGVQVMLSNSDCEFIRELYKEFHIHTITAARLINCKAKRRGKITEVLVTSYPRVNS
jgi:DNA adenine methylase